MPETRTQHGKSFDENIGILFDELMLAAKWGRPSVLLAIHKSRFGQEKADKALSSRLANQGVGVARLVVDGRQADVAGLIRAAGPGERPVYFISNIDWGGGEDGKEAYRALNLQRELFVEQGIKAVFWLTSGEATNLARYAPDFWAFRHRVVEFITQRAPAPVRLPAGVLLWDREKSVDPFDSLQAGILAREDLLKKLPANAEALSTRIELYHSIGYLQWTAGNLERATAAIRAGLALAEDRDLAELISRLLNGKGIIEYESGEYLEALESFKEGLQYRSSSRALLINLGAVSCKLGRNLEALSTVKKALRANPTDAETWNRFGYIQATMGKPDEAIVSLLKAVELAPRVAAYHESAAVLYGVVNRPDEATRALARARELAAEPEQEYLRILEEAILGDLPRAAERLRLAEATGKIPGHAIRRDPNLTLLFASDKTDAQRG